MNLHDKSGSPHWDYARDFPVPLRGCFDYSSARRPDDPHIITYASNAHSSGAFAVPSSINSQPVSQINSSPFPFMGSTVLS